LNASARSQGFGGAFFAKEKGGDDMAIKTTEQVAPMLQITKLG
jgi:hypothetical protein